MSVCALYDIIKMRPPMWQLRFFYIIQMIAGMFLKVLYRILLKWELVCVWMSFIWYYKESWNVSERALYDIVNMRGFMFLNDLYMILLKWVFLWMRFIWYYWNGSCMCWNALYKILLKWELICAWMQFVRYKQNQILYVPECDV